ncbi:MAG: hypothetical protein JW940_30445 [Polyangiaceae bacterium]|nr:hypothetical protein [Polyangiaceae bacterium]
MTLQADLLVLTADADTQKGLEALLERHVALGTRPVRARVLRHSGRDPGCRRRSHDFLRPYLRQYERALVIFDRHGCGDERARALIEEDVEAALAANGWEGRSAAVVIDPELEAWVWAESAAVARILGWEGRRPTLREWLVASSLAATATQKPRDPKSAMRRALGEVRQPVSAGLFAELARVLPLESCVDPAFGKLRATLRRWFPG